MFLKSTIFIFSVLLLRALTECSTNITYHASEATSDVISKLYTLGVVAARTGVHCALICKSTDGCDGIVYIEEIGICTMVRQGSDYGGMSYVHSVGNVVRLKTDRVTAAAVDECATNNGECAHVCTDSDVNSPGHTCSCHSDYQLMPDGHKCTSTGPCNGEFSWDSGSFTSVNHPQDYPSNLDCTLVIQSPPGTYVSLVFTAFDIESGSCSFDYVRVEDSNGGLLTPVYGFCIQMCGAASQLPTPAITSPNNYMAIVFRSDGSATNSGYRGQVTFAPLLSPLVG